MTPVTCRASSPTRGTCAHHDIAWAEDELWICATRFSCLATLNGEHSFVPRWRPPFISDLKAEDRCHLNGMAVIDDRVRYVTALGETNERKRVAAEQGRTAGS